MSTVKISDLPLISILNANTANSLFMGVDIPTGSTGKFTAHTLAQGLYSNEILNVGTNQQNLPNTIAQFSLGGQSYIQTNLVNTNDGGSADIVVTANAGSGGTDSTNFIDMGYANKNYQPGSEFNNIGTAIYPLDGYLYVQGTASSNGGNLVIGTTTSNTNLRFIVGGGTAANVVAKMTSNSLVMSTNTTIAASNISIGGFVSGDLIPSQNNVFNLGSPTNRWSSLYIGPNTINMLDTVTGNSANLTIVNGIFQISGPNQLQIGQLKFNYNTIESTLPSIDLQIGSGAASANLVLNRNVVTSSAKSMTVSGPFSALSGITHNTRVPPNTTNAVTIDFATDDLIHIHTSGPNTTVTATLINQSNNVGKIVEVMIISSAGGTTQFNHGVSSTNSSNGSSFFYTTKQFMSVKYYNIDGTSGNTFVTGIIT